MHIEKLLTENLMKIEGYKLRSDVFAILFYYCFSSIFKFFPSKIVLSIFYAKSCFKNASHLFIEINERNYVIEKIQSIKIDSKNVDFISNFGSTIKFFEIFKTRFIYNRKIDRFIKPVLCGGYINEKIMHMESIIYNKNYANNIKKIDNYAMHEKEVLYGHNIITLPLPNLLEIFIQSTFTFENTYLAIVLYVWYMTDYQIYASILIIITLITLIVEIYKSNKANYKIQKETEDTLEKVVKLKIRDNKIYREQILPKNLLPGDFIEIKETKRFFCDALIIKGDLIVDESYLTGESIPVPKSNKEMVFLGCKILNSQKSIKNNNTFETIGIVTKTGFNTVYGNLMKQVLIPKKSTKSKFTGLKRYLIYFSIFIITLFIFFCIYYILIYKNIIKLFIYRNNKKIELKLGLSFYKAIILSFDLVTVLLNPSFSSAFKMGILSSLARLKQVNIQCMKIKSIEESGLVDIILFDKTGTLTESNMKVHKSIYEEKYKEIFSISQSVCHNLKKLENNQIVGDPMDLSMFEYSKAEFLDKNIIKNKEKIIKILKTIPFNTERKRITVDISIKNKYYRIIKGCPEVIEDLLKSVPENYQKELYKYSMKGFRAIAFCYKELEDKENIEEKEEDGDYLNIRSEAEIDIKRYEINIKEIKEEKKDEKNCIFIGFLLFSNPLKKETSKSIEILREADIPSIICSGDSIYTCISVARNIKIVEDVCMPILNKEIFTPENNKEITANDPNPPLKWIIAGKTEGQKNWPKKDLPIAIEGIFLEQIKDTDLILYEEVLKRCRVYARMSPEQKMNIVKDLRKIEKGIFFHNKSKDYLNIMYVGDGANDCGALNSANIGISLSPHIAVCNFIARSGNIKEVTTIIKEGRSALISSKKAFRIVLETSLFTYFFLVFSMLSGEYLSEFHTMFHDIFLILPVNLIISTFKPSEKLISINAGLNEKIEIDKKKKIYKKKLTKNLKEEVEKLKKYLILPFLSIFLLKTFLIVFKENCECFPNFNAKFLEVKVPTLGHSKKCTIIFYILTIQIFICCFFNSQGKPHRENRNKNKIFIFYFIVNLLFIVSLIFLSLKILPSLSLKLDICLLNKKEIIFTTVLCFLNIFIYKFFEKLEFSQ